MTLHDEPAGLVLVCDHDGRIVEVVRDGLGTAVQALLGRPLTALTDERSLADALSFLAAVQARGTVFDWALTVPAAGEPMTLHFAATLTGEELSVSAARSAAELRDLIPRAEMLAEDPTAERPADESRRVPGAGGGPPDEEMFDEMTRLNNELVRMQRELAKRNAELQRLNQLAHQHADELELRVEERSIELRASQAKLGTMLATAGLGVAVVDRGGRVTEANGALWAMLQAGDDDLLGRPLADLFYDPDGGSDLEDLYGELVDGERDHYRLEGYCTRRNGELAWVNMTLAALKGQGPTPEAAIAMIDEVTEKRQTQTALIHAERLALAGKLAASLAHEINNPLQSVIGCVGLAEEAVTAGESPEEYLTLARTELRRVADMVGRMRELHKAPRPDERRLTDLNGLLDQVLALSRRQCDEHGVRVVRRLESNVPPVVVEADQLRQVFLNVILNALDAMPGGGRLVVQSERAADPTGARVTFADDGAGIPADVLPHIFKAFYSTKPGGTGIGLAITQDIVRRHGGHIEVETEVGLGSRVSVWLPAAGTA